VQRRLRPIDRLIVAAHIRKIALQDPFFSSLLDATPSPQVLRLLVLALVRVLPQAGPLRPKRSFRPRKGGSVIALDTGLDTGSVLIRMHDSKTTIQHTRPYTRVIQAA
jgi:hypothetical protein